MTSYGRVAVFPRLIPARWMHTHVLERYAWAAHSFFVPVDGKLRSPLYHLTFIYRPALIHSRSFVLILRGLRRHSAQKDNQLWSKHAAS